MTPAETATIYTMSASNFKEQIERDLHMIGKIQPGPYSVSPSLLCSNTVMFNENSDVRKDKGVWNVC